MSKTDFSHRGGLRPPIRPDGTLFERVGGRPVVDAIVDGLYDRIEADSSIREMFLRNLEGERDKQKAFWEEWLGGEQRYTHHHAYSGLASRHAHLHITRKSAETWLTFLAASLDEAVASPELRQEILKVARPIALAFVNETEEAAPKDLRCRRIRPFRELKKLAERGQTGEVVQTIEACPDLLDDAIEMAEILQVAAYKGRTETVSALLDAGVDVNRTAHFKEGCIFQSLMLTPLCVALLKGRKETAERLREAGAVYDVFSAAYLGDADKVAGFIDTDPEVVNAPDPSSDVLEMTPLHHAVYGGHLDVVRLLLDHGALPGVNSSPMVRHAANNGRVEVVRLLLDHDADATRVGPGVWVLEHKISKLLMAGGADVNYPDGEWIWRSCTGNNSQRDNPELVAALLDHGADIDKRLRGATALHYVAKAGFIETAKVLLDRGADPNAQTPDGESPLFYAFKAGKRADVPEMCRLLVRAGADATLENRKGQTPTDVVGRMRRDDREIVAALCDRG